MARSNSPYYVPSSFGGSSQRYASRTTEVTGTTGVLTVAWDFRPMIRLAARIVGETRSADSAIKLAHTEMALAVQNYAAGALEEQIAHRGPRGIGPRQQRGTKLIDALTDDRARRVDLTGFAVGYLDDVPGVEKYWRRIEEGSETQVGQVFYGAFLTSGGKWAWPTNDESLHVDPKLYKFASGPLTATGSTGSYKDRTFENGNRGRGRTPIVHIQRPIPAYHYLARGFQEWLGNGGRFSGAETSGVALAKETILGTYAQAFDVMGLADFNTWWFARYHAPPSAASPTRSYGSMLPGA